MKRRFYGFKLARVLATASSLEVPFVFSWNVYGQDNRTRFGLVDMREDSPHLESLGAKTSDKTEKDQKSEEPKDGGIDFDGLQQRVARVPLESDNYYGLTVKSDALVGPEERLRKQ